MVRFRIEYLGCLTAIKKYDLERSNQPDTHDYAPISLPARNRSFLRSYSVSCCAQYSGTIQTDWRLQNFGRPKRITMFASSSLTHFLIPRSIQLVMTPLSGIWSTAALLMGLKPFPQRKSNLSHCISTGSVSTSRIGYMLTATTRTWTLVMWNYVLVVTFKPFWFQWTVLMALAHTLLCGHLDEMAGIRELSKPRFEFSLQVLVSSLSKLTVIATGNTA